MLTLSQQSLKFCCFLVLFNLTIISIDSASTSGNYEDDIEEDKGEEEEEFQEESNLDEDYGDDEDYNGGDLEPRYGFCRHHGARCFSHFQCCSRRCLHRGFHHGRCGGYFG